MQAQNTLPCIPGQVLYPPKTSQDEPYTLKKYQEEPYTPQNIPEQAPYSCDSDRPCSSHSLMVMGHHHPMGLVVLSGQCQEEPCRAVGKAEPGELDFHKGEDPNADKPDAVPTCRTPLS